MDTNELMQQANEIFTKELERLQTEKGKKQKSEIAELRAPQQLLGLEGSNFCKVAPQTVTLIEKEINTFSWFIPDNIEIPALAVLKTLEVILPQFCGAAAGPVQPVLRTNVKQGK